MGDVYFDQIDRTGHNRRAEDLDLIAGLGAKAVRYPVLWERVAPQSVATADWRWPDESLAILSGLKIRPIVGLVHHGSGPRYTSLIDPQFPEKLAEYAAAVAHRYPWVEAYTPVNEPLTTARFSGLYGHWYPHGRDDRTFVRALLNQCRGTVLAMRAIRGANPAAILVQTDDLGHVSSTPHLRYQADMENERRWITFDLLCGNVDERHPLWNYLTDYGQADLRQLRWFSENPCPPDIVGLNYYLSSERFLHEKLFLYPRDFHGGNRHEQYVDIETARTRTDGLVGAKRLLLSAWERFHVPLAITECHNGCTREEQMRWLVEVWQGCQDAIAEGADVRAITAWSLFGAFDWNSLVTRRSDHYEPGVFDVRSPGPRRTALADCFQQFALGRKPEHPLLDIPGWWQRPERFIHGFSVLDSGKVIPAGGLRSTARKLLSCAVRPLFLIGAPDALNRALVDGCEQRGISYRALDRSSFDREMLEFVRPWAVVDLSGPELHIADLCAAADISLLAFSSDLVFDGMQSRDYVETDPPSTSALADAESAVLARCPQSLVIRTGPTLAACGGDILCNHLRDLAQGRPFRLNEDRIFSPTYLPDLVQYALDLLIDRETGVWHLANVGPTTWFELIASTAEPLGISLGPGLSPSPLAGRTVLGSVRGDLMPAIDTVLARYLRQIAPMFENRATLAAA